MKRISDDDLVFLQRELSVEVPNLLGEYTCALERFLLLPVATFPVAALSFDADDLLLCFSSLRNSR